MITQNVDTLKIHKLTQAQYERELAAGRLDETAIYLTPEEGVSSFRVFSGTDVPSDDLGNIGDLYIML